MLSKKNSRPITVDGQEFRWLVSPDSTYIVFVAECSNEPGRKIEVYVDSDINRLWTQAPVRDGFNFKVLKPHDAASIINQALNKGWNPREKGKPLKFDCSEDGRIEQREA